MTLRRAWLNSYPYRPSQLHTFQVGCSLFPFPLSLVRKPSAILIAGCQLRVASSDCVSSIYIFWNLAKRFNFFIHLRHRFHFYAVVPSWCADMKWNRLLTIFPLWSSLITPILSFFFCVWWISYIMHIAINAFLIFVSMSFVVAVLDSISFSQTADLGVVSSTLGELTLLLSQLYRLLQGFSSFKILCRTAFDTVLVYLIFNRSQEFDWSSVYLEGPCFLYLWDSVEGWEFSKEMQDSASTLLRSLHLPQSFFTAYQGLLQV